MLYRVVLFSTCIGLLVAENVLIDHNIRATNLKITNGSTTDANSISYQAYIDATTLNASRSCSGSLISRNCIITAAQCIEGAIFINVWIGSRDLSDTNSLQKLESINYTIHENYDSETYENDIGVIYLSHINITEDMEILELPTQEEADSTYYDEFVTVSGWGKVNETVTSSDVLLSVNSTVVPDLMCWEAFGYFPINDMCTLSEKGACQGDMGGPIVLNYKLIGVISRVEDSCKEGYVPNISVKVGYFLDWIRSKTDIS
ncbi:hypothetical protein NQ317_007416 [Molorchus minor]|uniref:Peptidase S1 domain-containing protein n=1 Tax=Molorchus minor TaxID=1323400 RepID=A0ABQ9JDM9_9CUCU|nr:hypothetical protein NQ317_007416 [Molorchus minor]